MALSHQLPSSNAAANGLLLEKVITTNDLSGLTPIEKVNHIKNVCESLGLNPLTKPLQLIKFQGKEIMYVTKDATEQLRKNHKVSITQVENKIMNGIYIVTVHATTPDGRTDASTGAIAIDGLKGENLCNALLKAETKAKRRVTLSICGLGFIDESEAESIPQAKKIDVHKEAETYKDYSLDEVMVSISQCLTLEELEGIFKSAYKYFLFKKDKESLDKVIFAKNSKKNYLESLEIETGEVFDEVI